MDSSPPDLDRLAQHALERRRELGLTVTAITVKGGLSKDTYAHVEKAEPVTASSHAKAEAALDWAAGSIRAVLNGGQPTPVRGRIAPADLGRVVTSAVVAVADTLTGAEIREISRIAVEELARRGLTEPSDEGEGT